MPKNMSYRDRFFEKINITDNCWIWTGAKTSNGYGSFKSEDGVVSAHRYSYEIHYEKISEGMVVCHSCDIRLCVNPQHLWIGSISDNNKDMFSKGRNGSSTKPKTHCKNGHEFNKINTYERVRKDGKIERACRECKRITARNRRVNPETRDNLLKYEREYQRTYYHRNK